MKITKKSDGFTLIEIMVAVAIMGILMAGIYGIFTSIYNSYLSQNQLADVEQNARIGIEQMMREIRLAGFNYKNTQIYKTTATDFVFQADVGAPQRKKIEYYWDNAKRTLIRGEESDTTGSGDFPSNGTAITQAPLMTPGYLQTLASPVTNLAFTYYDANNNAFTTTSSSNFSTITRVRVTLTTLGSQPSPDKIGVLVNGKVYKQVTVDADIRLRNMGTGQANADNTPPSAPTGIQVRDTGNPCDSLTVSWTPNTETDLAGYTIYIRQTGSPAPYSSINAGNLTTYVIQKNLIIGTTYDVKLQAYDTSGNFSVDSTIVSAANTNSNDGTSDTQPNILLPAAPTITNATAGDKSVTLTWTASTTLGIDGYNIYRSAYSGSGYGAWVLLNQTGSETGTTYTDTFPDILAPNCPLTYQNKQPYQYKMASVACGGSGSIGSYTSPVSGPDGGTPYNTYPKDSVAPGDPTNFAGSAGTNQVLLSWIAPTDADIFGVKVVSNNGPVNDLTYNTYPSLASYLRQVYLDASIVTAGQSNGAVDNGLTNNTVYTYTAYSFDKCGNFSAGAQSKTLAIPCGDATYPGAPGNPTNLNGTSCGLVRLTWTAPTVNGNGTVFNPMPGDVIGYNIYRCTSAPCTKGIASGWNGAGTPLNKTVYTTTTYDDTTGVSGQTYYYAVTAIDCVLSPPNESGYASTPIGLSTGGLTQDVYFDSGFSTGSNTSTTFKDTTKNWTVNAYQNATLKITGGTDAGEVRPIVGNSTTSITIPATYTWPATLPDSTSAYEIDRPVIANSSNSSTAPYAHDDVKFFVKNTNASSVAVRSSTDSAVISWSNASAVSGVDNTGVTALLSAVKVNGTTLWSVNAPSFGVTSGTNITFTTGISFTGLQSGVLMELVFADSNGLASSMMGETINISMTYGILNGDGITYTTCSWNTGNYPIRVSSGVSIPEINQYPTALSTVSPWLVTTAYGTNIMYAGTTYTYTSCNGYSTSTYTCFWSPSAMTAPTGNMITSATLYYCKQSWGGASWGANLTTSAPVPGDSCYQMNGSPITMTVSASQNQGWFVTSIPETGEPYRIWFYILAADNQGNSSVSPGYNASSFAAYTYDRYNVFSISSYSMSWSNMGVGSASNKRVDITGTVLDVAGSNNAPGASVSILFQETSGPSETLTYTLDAGSNTFSSNRIFSGDNSVTATMTITKPGFKPKTCSATLKKNGDVLNSSCL